MTTTTRTERTEPCLTSRRILGSELGQKVTGTTFTVCNLEAWKLIKLWIKHSFHLLMYPWLHCVTRSKRTLHHYIHMCSLYISVQIYSLFSVKISSILLESFSTRYHQVFNTYKSIIEIRHGCWVEETPVSVHPKCGYWVWVRVKSLFRILMFFQPNLNLYTMSSWSSVLCAQGYCQTGTGFVVPVKGNTETFTPYMCDVMSGVHILYDVYCIVYMIYSIILLTSLYPKYRCSVFKCKATSHQIAVYKWSHANEWKAAMVCCTLSHVSMFGRNIPMKCGKKQRNYHQANISVKVNETQLTFL